SQCLIQPPQDRPYFLLLQSYSKEDFVLYVMTRPQHIFGRPERRGGPEKPGGCPETPPPTPETPDTPQKLDSGPFSVVDTFLSAPDILPRHCLVQATPGGGGDPGGDPPSATVRPFRGAPATLNGSPLLRRAPLNSGDLLGLGEYVLLLYKDPRVGEEVAARPPWVPPPRASLGILGVLGCAGCGRSPRERRDVLRGALETPKAELRYRPQDEGMLLRDILNMDLGGSPRGDLGEGSPGVNSGDSGGDSGEDLGGLAPAFLLGLCLDHAAREFPAGHFPELLGRVAGMLRETVW
ncbi:RAIN protein, partial [Callaeas wilsoni]|nr:RAIN protein [Callaeas wilsoni]